MAGEGGEEGAAPLPQCVRVAAVRGVPHDGRPDADGEGPGFEVGVGGVGVHAPGRYERDPGQRFAQGTQIGRAAHGGGEELDGGGALADRPDDLGGGQRPGDDGQSERVRGEAPLGERGRDDEGGAGLLDGTGVVAREYRAGADEGVTGLPGAARDDPGRVRGRQGHLDEGDALLAEDVHGPLGGLRVRASDDGDHAFTAESVGEAHTGLSSGLRWGCGAGRSGGGRVTTRRTIRPGGARAGCARGRPLRHRPGGPRSRRW